MLRPGCRIKIEDIGQLATCLTVDGDMVVAELDGDVFSIPASLVEVIETAA